MDCEKYIEIMMRELDGEATAAEKLELRGHMMACDRCCALYETYRNIDAGIMDMELQAPEGLKDAVMGAIRQEKEKQSPLYFLKRYKFTLTALAACLALVVVGRGFGMGSASVDGMATETAQMARMEPEEAEEAAPAEPQIPAAAEGAALMPVYEETGEAADQEAIQDMAVGTGDLVSVLRALEKEQYAGDLVCLTGHTPEDILGIFDTVYMTELSNGFMVYRVLREDFEALMDQLTWSDVVSTNPPGEDVYLYIAE